MKNDINNDMMRKTRRTLWLLPCLLGGLVMAGAVWAHQQQGAAEAAQGDAAAAPQAYHVIKLGQGDLTALPEINANNQVAFSLSSPSGGSRAWFYNGVTAQDIGTLGGADSYAFALNNAGQVVGTSAIGNGPLFHAYLWSARTGMQDLGTLAGRGSSSAVAINNGGQVAGGSTSADSSTHAFRWSAGAGMEDLGVLAADALNYSYATAINEAGAVAGVGSTASGDQHAVAWTRATGLSDLGTFGGTASYSVGIDSQGRVAGYATDPGARYRAFVWSRRSGLLDLGTAGGTESFALAMSGNGNVAGVFNIDETQRAFFWRRNSGLVDLGTLGGIFSRALGVNNRGQVVGGSITAAGERRGFVWTAREGMVDLNQRLRHAPAGLVVDFAIAISESGAIVATSNAGLVLLRPDCGCSGMHRADPVSAVETADVGAPGAEADFKFAAPALTGAAGAAPVSVDHRTAPLR